MRVRLSFFYTEGDPFREIIFRDYSRFRQWGLQSENHSKVNAQVLDFLLKNEACPVIRSIEEELLNQLVCDLWEFLSQQKTFLSLGHSIGITSYENELVWSTESEVLYCWNFLMYGRSIKDPAKFFRAIDPQAVKLGYWTESERKMMEDKLGRVYRRGVFHTVSSVSQILQDNRHLPGEFLFSIM